MSVREMIEPKSLAAQRTKEKTLPGRKETMRRRRSMISLPAGARSGSDARYASPRKSVRYKSACRSGASSRGPPRGSEVELTAPRSAQAWKSSTAYLLDGRAQHRVIQPFDLAWSKAGSADFAPVVSLTVRDHHPASVRQDLPHPHAVWMMQTFFRRA
jgi:hypothetical protein